MEITTLCRRLLRIISEKDVLDVSYEQTSLEIKRLQLDFNGKEKALIPALEDSECRKYLMRFHGLENLSQDFSCKLWRFEKHHLLMCDLGVFWIYSMCVHKGKETQVVPGSFKLQTRLQAFATTVVSFLSEKKWIGFWTKVLHKYVWEGVAASDGAGDWKHWFFEFSAADYSTFCTKINNLRPGNEISIIGKYLSNYNKWFQ